MSRQHGDAHGSESKLSVRAEVAEKAPAHIRLRGLDRVLIAAPVALLGYFAWLHRTTVDDGFIYMRVVDQLRAGHGPVFNAGQRVEAFTSPAWLALLSVASFIPVRLEWIATLLGIACSLGGPRGRSSGSSHATRSDAGRAVYVPVGALVFVMFPPVWVYSTTGLETGLVFAWQGACLWLLARWATSPDHVMPTLAAAVLGFGWLVRPELAVYSIVFALVVLVGGGRRDHARDRVRVLSAMLALPLAYQLFRMGYFGSLVANTAIAKEGFSTHWQRGWHYLHELVTPYTLWLPLSVLAVCAYAPLVARLSRLRQHRSILVVAGFVVGGILNTVYVVRVGGDWMYGRLLLPSLFALCAPVAVVPFTKRYLASLLVVLGVSAFAFTAEPRNLESLDAKKVTLPEWQIATIPRSKGLYYQRWIPYGWKRVRVAIAPDVPLPAAAIASLGALGYAAGPRWYVVDLLGLADPVAAHMRLVGEGAPGHEKPIPEYWTVARLTAQDTNVFRADFPPGLRLVINTRKLTGDQFARQVHSARAALDCGGIRRLEQAAAAPLTIGRFVSNILHAYDNTRLRIPRRTQGIRRLLRAPLNQPNDTSPRTQPGGLAVLLHRARSNHTGTALLVQRTCLRFWCELVVVHDDAEAHPVEAPHPRVLGVSGEVHGDVLVSFDGRVSGHRDTDADARSRFSRVE